MSTDLFAKFCIDTCALVDLFGRKFPRDLYPDLWPAVEGALLNGSVVSVREVYREIAQQDDELAAWAKRNRGCFRDPDEAQLREITRIANAYPDCLDMRKRRPVHADPWVIAAALAWSLTPVTSESPASPKKIPAICRAEGIKCADLFDLFRELGWTFETGGQSGE